MPPRPPPCPAVHLFLPSLNPLWSSYVVLEFSRPRIPDPGDKVPLWPIMLRDLKDKPLVLCSVNIPFFLYWSIFFFFSLSMDRKLQSLINTTGSLRKAGWKTPLLKEKKNKKRRNIAHINFIAMVSWGFIQVRSFFFQSPASEACAVCCSLNA